MHKEFVSPLKFKLINKLQRLIIEFQNLSQTRNHISIVKKETIPLEIISNIKLIFNCLHKSFAIQCNKRSIVNKPRQHQQLENKLLGMQGIRSEYRSANAIYGAMLPPILIGFLVSSTNLFEPSRSRQSWA